MVIVRDGIEYELTFSEVHEIYHKYKRECLIADIEGKAEDMGIDLTGKDIEKIATRANRAIENNDGLWESYWMSIEYVLQDA